MEFKYGGLFSENRLISLSFDYGRKRNDNDAGFHTMCEFFTGIFKKNFPQSRSLERDGARFMRGDNGRTEYSVFCWNKTGYASYKMESKYLK